MPCQEGGRYGKTRGLLKSFFATTPKKLQLIDWPRSTTTVDLKNTSDRNFESRDIQFVSVQGLVMRTGISR